MLNGTPASGLASNVMAKLSAAGYNAGTVANAPAQHAATIVGYLAAADRADAVEVAKALGLSASAVAAVAAADRAMACAATPSACPAQVVVTVGNDLAATG